MRLLPRHGGRQHEVRLRGRRGFRRPPGQLRRTATPPETLRARREGRHGALPQRIGQARRLPRIQRRGAGTPGARVQTARSHSRNARPAHPQEHQDHPAGARAHAAPAGGSARTQFQRSRARPRSGRRLPRGRTLPALQEAALRSRLSGGHRYPRLHLRSGAQRRRSVLPYSEKRQRAARGLRTRLPAGIAVRSHLRGRAQVQAGGHRPPGALRRRCGHGPRMGAAGGSHRRRNQARRHHRQRSRGAGLRRGIGPPRRGGHDLRGACTWPAEC